MSESFDLLTLSSYSPCNNIKDLLSAAKVKCRKGKGTKEAHNIHNAMIYIQKKYPELYTMRFSDMNVSPEETNICKVSIPPLESKSASSIYQSHQIRNSPASKDFEILTQKNNERISRSYSPSSETKYSEYSSREI